MLRDAACGGEVGACSASVSCQTHASDASGCEAEATSGIAPLATTLTGFALPPSVATRIVHRNLIRSQPLHSSCSSSCCSSSRRPLPKPVCTRYSSWCSAAAAAARCRDTLCFLQRLREKADCDSKLLQDMGERMLQVKRVIVAAAITFRRRQWIIVLSADLIELKPSDRL